jgi:beta-lactamase regulating signal transducer with metallopeptidase domain
MIESMNVIARLWWEWMAAMTWQVVLVVGIIGAIDWLVRRWAWPQLRYALWSLVLLKLLLPPTLALPSGIIGGLRPAAQKAGGIADCGLQIADSHPATGSGFNVVSQPANNADDLSVMAGMPDVPTIANPQSAIRNPQLDWRVYVMSTWLLGVTALGVFLAVRLRGLGRGCGETCEAPPAPESFYNRMSRCADRVGLRRLPRVVPTTRLANPAVFGMFRPILLMPVGYLSRLSRRDTEHVLLHEFCHIKRGDLFVHGVTLVLQIVYWFNPLLWLVRRHIHRLRELCCDASVANLLREDTPAYRETLLETARRFLATHGEPGLGLLGLFEDSNCLLTRLRWLEKPTWRYRRMKKLIVVAVAGVMAACVLPMAQAQPTAAVSQNTTVSSAGDAPMASEMQELQKEMQAMQARMQQLRDRMAQLSAQHPAPAATLPSTVDANRVVDVPAADPVAIAQLLDLLGKQAKLNFAYEPADVAGDAAIKLNRDANGQATVKDVYGLLEASLRLRGLSMVQREGNVIAIVRQGPAAAKVTYKGPGLTHTGTVQVGGVPMVARAPLPSQVDDSRAGVELESQYSIAAIRPDTRVRVRNEVGSVKIRAGDDQNGTVTAKVKGKADTELQAGEIARKVQIRITPEQGLIDIGAIIPDDVQQANRSGVEVTLEITLPKRTQVQVSQRAGSVKVSGMEGSVAAEVDAGSIAAQNLTGDVALFTHAGSIDLVVPPNASAKILATAKVGSIKSDLPLGTLNLTNSTVLKSGDVPSSLGGAATGTLGAGQHSVSLQTEAGSIKITAAATPKD